VTPLAPGELALVLGGIRSGKSEFAERLAGATSSSVLYLATGSASDGEMELRIAAHRARRPDSWTTREVRADLAEVVRRERALHEVVLLDDIGFLIANLMEREPDRSIDHYLAAVESELGRVAALRALSPVPWIMVSSEVGLSLVAATTLGRVYADVMGFTNQKVGQMASRMYFVVAGRAVDVLRIGERVE
jgi:adenosylcobinamide kinase/adenosylcobinamide-phosphate guanylyltransferase